MMGSRFQQGDNLGRTILEIIRDYQAITTTDIWYELGEDERFDHGITHDEVLEILFHLEKQRLIIRGEEDKWEISRETL